MARTRTIKPDFWTDEKVGKLSMQARLLFIGTWTHADDNGVVRGNPAYLRAQIFPYDDNLRSGELNRWLDALVECRMLIPIMWQGERYYVIRTFRKHQRTDRRVVNELIPSDELAQLMAPDGDPTCTQRVHDVYTTGAQRVPDGCPKQKEEKEEKERIKEKEVKEENSSSPPSARAREDIPDFSTSDLLRLRIYFGGASPNCGAGVRVRPYLIRRPALAHKNPTRFSRGSMSTKKAKEEKSCAKKEEMPLYAPRSDSECVAVSDMGAWLAGETVWLEAICMNRGLSMSKLREYLDAFIEELKMQGVVYKPAHDVKRHFNNWLRKILQHHDENSRRTAALNGESINERLGLECRERVAERLRRANGGLGPGCDEIPF